MGTVHREERTTSIIGTPNIGHTSFHCATLCVILVWICCNNYVTFQKINYKLVLYMTVDCENKKSVNDDVIMMFLPRLWQEYWLP